MFPLEENGLERRMSENGIRLFVAGRARAMVKYKLEEAGQIRREEKTVTARGTVWSGKDRAMDKNELNDLVNSVKTFAEEVHNDTIGDAKKFYSNVAKSAEKNAKTARAKAKAKQEAIRREQEEMKKHRQQMMKRATVIFVAIIVIAAVVVSLVLRVG